MYLLFAFSVTLFRLSYKASTFLDFFARHPYENKMLSLEEIEAVNHPPLVPRQLFARFVQQAIKRAEHRMDERYAALKKALITKRETEPEKYGPVRLDAHEEGNFFHPSYARLQFAYLTLRPAEKLLTNPHHIFIKMHW